MNFQFFKLQSAVAKRGPLQQSGTRRASLLVPPAHGLDAASPLTLQASYAAEDSSQQEEEQQEQQEIESYDEADSKEDEDSFRLEQDSGDYMSSA